MAKLKLTDTPIDVLEIELPDGGELKLSLKNEKVKDATATEKNIDELTKKFESKKISSIEYSIGMMDLLCHEYDHDVIGELEVNHLLKISSSLREIQEKAIDSKKKGNSSQPTKTSN